MKNKPEPPEGEKQDDAISEAERKEAKERTAISAAVVHEAIREEGLYELSRPSIALMWSGLAAGLSMGFSLIGQGLITRFLEGASWALLVSSLGYSIGFLIVVLGRQQLFTENTLTAVIPVLYNRKLSSFLDMLRLWGIVLITNLVGVFVVAWVVANTEVFSPEVQSAFTEIGQEAIRFGFSTTLLKGVFSGWLIALMVWLLPAAESARIWVVIIITYIVSLGGMPHIIGGSADTLYLVASGNIIFANYLINFMVPTLIGNIIGGVSIVAALNYAQVVSGSREG